MLAKGAARDTLRHCCDERDVGVGVGVGVEVLPNGGVLERQSNVEYTCQRGAPCERLMLGCLVNPPRPPGLVTLYA